MHNLVVENAAEFMRIVVTGNDLTESYDLHEGESALVGHAAGCQLRIDDSAVAPHQCLLEMRGGKLLLHNWCEHGSTTLNGSPVTEEVSLDFDAVIGFGDYRIHFQLGASESNSSAGWNEDKTSTTQRALELGHEKPFFELPEVESVEDSTIALLHSEIAFLQKELEQRDSMIAHAGNSSVAHQDTEKPTVSANRFNELLAELQVSDGRLMSLTDEIRLLEELRAAETEERQQLTVWVNEVEKLVANREEERRAEIEVLTQRLEREKADRLLHQQRADDSLDSGENGTGAVHDTLKVLRRDHELLREKLDAATGTVNELQHECQTLRQANTEAAVEQRIREVIRLERLEIAQERARIFRREHELTRKLREVESQLENKRGVHEADARFQAFREQLKELHEAEEPICEAPSVGQRLVNLWKSLDGPTDTD